MAPESCSITACVCAHNAAALLPLTLAYLRNQEGLEADAWEVLVVDNKSSDDTGHVAAAELRRFPCHTSVLREDTPGLNYARRRGALEASGKLLVYVDDDNLLAPDFLARCRRFFAEHPGAGVVGGRAVPRFDGCERPDYWDDVRGFLATNEDAPEEDWLRSPAGEYRSVPFGAGMAFRRGALLDVYREEPIVCPDRKGKGLGASGDLELGCRVVTRGWEAWHCGGLFLEHVIPAQRLELRYILRLQRAVANSHALYEHVVVEGKDYPPPFPTAAKQAWWYLRNRLRDGTVTTRYGDLTARLRQARLLGRLDFRLGCLLRAVWQLVARPFSAERRTGER